VAVARGFAAAVMFAGLALGLAAPVSAAPVMSGHYIETQTASNGQSASIDWYFTPCGDGCAQLTSPTTALARLVNRQWIIDVDGDTLCHDGSRVPKTNTQHITWDPYTLAGTAQIIESVATCGDTQPRSWTTNMQLRQADEGSTNQPH
jgi:hypothetical protein